MSRAPRKVLFLALVALLAATVVLATVAPHTDDDHTAALDNDADVMYRAADGGKRPVSHVSRVLFLNTSSQSFPFLPAGSKAKAVIAFRNSDEEVSQVVFLLAGFLQPPGQYHAIIQNFSVVRQARVVQKSETVSMHYTFTPDAHLEPGEYNMVLGLYAQDSSTNKTYFMTAFNSTVMVGEPLGTDPRTILTYFTLLVIFGGIAYVAADKVGLVKKMTTVCSKSESSSSTSGSGSNYVEMGTGNTGYDPAYVNAEHQRYRDEVLRRSSASSSTRYSSASPKKKK
ncbi:hypothetical protein JKF63_04355 [Porcisia hertigi]|uniref:Signal sequence receptor subunit alpha n=1 Tax=Porcisia hertigi TaxID=2761500 RepID=A0A836I8M3_9TRYP|nr:hypothetical protein JKF63_04355 [Porcisia hertigi]